jgi:hypothetical protein
MYSHLHTTFSKFSLVRLFLIAGAIALAFLIRPPSSAAATVVGTAGPDTLAAIAGVGSYIRATYGTDFILDAELHCAGKRRCAVEKSSSLLTVNGLAQRGAMHQALRAATGNPRIEKRSDTVTCDQQSCNVRGATHFVQVMEPAFKGDTATVAIHVYSNNGRFVRISAASLLLTTDAKGNYKVQRVDRRG